MILHVGYEIPVKEDPGLDCDSPVFTPEETRILKNQIRKNRELIDSYIRRIDLFVNHERHGSRDKLVAELRARLSVLMEENDTFRKVFWSHFK